jgi:hypothetical protein
VSTNGPPFRSGHPRPGPGSSSTRSSCGGNDVILSHRHVPEVRPHLLQRAAAVRHCRDRVEQDEVSAHLHAAEGCSCVVDWRVACFGHVAISAGGGFVSPPTVAAAAALAGCRYRTSPGHGDRRTGAGPRTSTGSAFTGQVGAADGAPSSVVDASAVAALFRRRQKHDAVLMIQGALAAEIGLDFASGPGVPGPAPRPHTRNGNASSDSAGLTPTASPAIGPYAG